MRAVLRIGPNNFGFALDSSVSTRYSHRMTNAQTTTTPATTYTGAPTAYRLTGVKPSVIPNAARGNTRPILGVGLLARTSGAVTISVTDSYCLGIAAAEPAAVNPDDTDDWAYLVPASALKSIERRGAVWSVDHQADTLNVVYQGTRTATILERNGTGQLGQFPSVDRLVPEPDRPVDLRAPVGVAAELITKIARFACKHAIVLRHGDSPERAIRFDLLTEQKQADTNHYGVIMPVRVTG